MYVKRFYLRSQNVLMKQNIFFNNLQRFAPQQVLQILPQKVLRNTSEFCMKPPPPSAFFARTKIIFLQENSANCNFILKLICLHE